MDNRYLRKQLLEIHDEAEAREHENLQNSKKYRQRLKEHCLEEPGNILIGVCANAALIEVAEVEAECQKDIKIKLAALLKDIDGDKRAAKQFKDFTKAVNRLLDALIVIDGRNSHCKFCDADLYENMGQHVEGCPLPIIAAYAGQKLPEV